MYIIVSENVLILVKCEKILKDGVSTVVQSWVRIRILLNLCNMKALEKVEQPSLCLHFVQRMPTFGNCLPIIL
jgi:hypothetical protein